jgi:hypothetical protein
MTSYWKEKGHYYGYPPCCIQEFLEKSKEILRTEAQKKVSGTGFVPCHHHSVAILKGDVKIEELILPTRQHSKPFKTESGRKGASTRGCRRALGGE